MGRAVLKFEELEDSRNTSNSSLLYVWFISAGDTFEENIKRHEAFLALKLGLKKGDKVLVSVIP